MSMWETAAGSSADHATVGSIQSLLSTVVRLLLRRLCRGCVFETQAGSFHWEGITPLARFLHFRVDAHCDRPVVHLRRRAHAREPPVSEASRKRKRGRGPQFSSPLSKVTASATQAHRGTYQRDLHVRAKDAFSHLLGRVCGPHAVAEVVEQHFRWLRRHYMTAHTHCAVSSSNSSLLA